MKRAAAYGAAALLAVVAFYGTARWWAMVTLRRIETEWRRDVAAERARVAAARRPALRGEARDANAAEEVEDVLRRFETAFEAFDASRRPPSWRRSGEGSPEFLDWVDEAARQPAGAAGPLSATATAYLDAHRGAIAALRAATRAGRCDWGFEFERGWAGYDSRYGPARKLVALLVVEGHERALAGDGRGAAERYLDCARFAADRGSNAPVVGVLVGAAVAQVAYPPLEALARSGTLGAEDLEAIERELGALEPVIPTAAGAFRIERLGMLGALLDLPPDHELGVRALRTWNVRGPIVQAWSVAACDRWLRDAAEACAMPAGPARDAALQALRDRAQQSRVAILGVVAFPPATVQVREDGWRAAHAAALAAVRAAR